MTATAYSRASRSPIPGEQPITDSGSIRHFKISIGHSDRVVMFKTYEKVQLRRWDENQEDSANLQYPPVIAEEIADDLRSALEQVEDILGD